MLPHDGNVVHAGVCLLRPESHNVLDTHSAPDAQIAVMTLEEYRKSNKISASEMGRRLGFAHTTVLRWEDGTIAPSRNAIRVIERATDGQVRPNDLFQAVV